MFESVRFLLDAISKIMYEMYVIIVSAPSLFLSTVNPTLIPCPPGAKGLRSPPLTFGTPALRYPCPLLANGFP